MSFPCSSMFGQSTLFAMVIIGATTDEGWAFLLPIVGGRGDISLPALSVCGPVTTLTWRLLLSLGAGWEGRVLATSFGAWSVGRWVVSQYLICIVQVQVDQSILCLSIVLGRGVATCEQLKVQLISGWEVLKWLIELLRLLDWSVRGVGLGLVIESWVRLVLNSNKACWASLWLGCGA